MLGVGVTTQLPVFVGLLGRGGQAGADPGAHPAAPGTCPFPATLEQPRHYTVLGLRFSRFPLVFPLAEGSGRE